MERERARNITDADREAADRLKRLWLAIPKDSRPTQQQISEGWQGGGDANQSLISQYMNGRIALNYRAVLEFARALGCAPEQIRDDLPEMRSGASQPLTLDPAKLATSMKFVDDLAEARDLELGLDARARLVTAVYAELLIEPTPNVVEMTIRYSKQLEGGDDGQRTAGRAGADDSRGAGKGARKAKAAAG